MTEEVSMSETQHSEWRSEQDLLNDERSWTKLAYGEKNVLQRELPAPTVAELRRNSWGVHPTPVDKGNPQRQREIWDLPTLWP
jgi:hypothetical protein